MKEAKRTIFWCPSCDRTLIAPGEKCRICGKIYDKSRKLGIKRNGQVNNQTTEEATEE